MKKLLLLALGLVTLLLSIFLGYSFGFGKKNEQAEITKPKSEILRIGLVADSHNENELLREALRQAQSKGVNFVIGLGDYTNLGTVEELLAAKKVFDESKLQYFVTAGDRDGWDSREKGVANFSNFNAVFGPATQKIEESGIQFVLLDNSDIYSGISQNDWNFLEEVTKVTKESEESKVKLTFVFAHKTPFHPDSAHIMGEDSPKVADQANRLIKLIEDMGVDGLFT
ncbi:MAG: metallophosphoesterase, partial [Candidatus Curtissbacteria bacterium]|nr:metallophosphoesterase [Candidatus Curtissbacteria bacterium]